MVFNTLNIYCLFEKLLSELKNLKIIDFVK